MACASCGDRLARPGRVAAGSHACHPLASATRCRPHVTLYPRATGGLSRRVRLGPFSPGSQHSPEASALGLASRDLTRLSTVVFDECASDAHASHGHASHVHAHLARIDARCGCLRVCLTPLDLFKLMGLFRWLLTLYFIFRSATLRAYRGPGRQLFELLPFCFRVLGQVAVGCHERRVKRVTHRHR